MYCQAADEEMAIAVVAVKPKYRNSRWQKIGYVCHLCASKGKPVKVDPFELKETK